MRAVGPHVSHPGGYVLVTSSLAAAVHLPLGGHGHLSVSPVEPAIDAIERGVLKRSRRVVSPWWVPGVLAVRPIAQRVLELQSRRGLATTLDIARGEEAVMTTEQPHPSA